MSCVFDTLSKEAGRPWRPVYALVCNISHLLKGNVKDTNQEKIAKTILLIIIAANKYSWFEILSKGHEDGDVKCAHLYT